jgi:hypothetical protein
MKRFKTKDEPTKEEWSEILSEFKQFEPGDMVEYGAFKTPFKVVKMIRDDKFGKSYYIENEKRGLLHGTSGFLFPLGTFIDDGKDN